jgi:hypothetical protein
MNNETKSTVPEYLFKGIDLSTTLLPREVDAIRRMISMTLKQPDWTRDDAPIGQAQTGIYAFYDYEGEPIYVGQTAESFSTRIGRHLTGQRSDSVGKYVLDPFEVYAIALWSLPHIATKFSGRDRKLELDKYEYTVHHLLTKRSKFGAVLNEGEIAIQELKLDLPEPVTGVIIPDEIFAERAHPDIRIARRALTISLLAKNISERKVSKGLRRALLVQTRRLEDLAARRYDSLASVPDESNTVLDPDGLQDDDSEGDK